MRCFIPFNSFQDFEEKWLDELTTNVLNFLRENVKLASNDAKTEIPIGFLVTGNLLIFQMENGTSIDNY
jgi:hypothetical protein